ncbi:hypothetical protein [Kitasatospora cheerisanensis]|uniref:Uncharacterized protein n=1 Tax=Kitasatospora cheerisanensis KCTC 2395 TaxID=1348663 RepID=A0A066Z815_9ACTN|nr:hypothetical protein [Kitasatospora cheerisanensis]KDN86300.1 hypothetical protein KCH_21170 [Kitasatospora cheerisanensis KCTC 2395]
MALCGVAAVGAVALVLVPATVPETSRGDTALVSVVVNGGRTVELGPTETRTFPVEVTATDRSGIRAVDPIGLWGPNYATLKVGPMTCVPLDATGTVSRCTGEATAAATSRVLFDDQAGTWFVDLRIRAGDGDRYVSKSAGGFSLKRTAGFDEVSAPARAASGDAVQVQARLRRAMWDEHDWVPQPGTLVYLQFRPAGSDTWTTLSAAGTDGEGRVSMQMPARLSGAYQWFAPGDKWTGAAVSAEIPVEVDAEPVHPGQ